MLGRFSTAFQNAVDILAPPPPLQEDFAYHWKKLIKHYLDVTNSRNVPIELTNIPARFDQISKILAKEDGGLEDDKRPGPCLEYFLQHSLLDLLATLATSDDPPGMRQHIFQFTAKFLTNIKPALFAHNNVFQPLQRLVFQCDGTCPGPTESYEVNFLLGLAAVVRQNPSLVQVFTSSTDSWDNSPEIKRRSSCCSSEVSCLSSSCISELSCATSSNPPLNNPLFTPMVTSARSKVVRLVTPPDSLCQEIETVSSCSSSDDNKSLVVDDSAQFPLLDAAISYIQSPDCNVRVKACQTIMLLVSLPDARAAEVIVSDTLLLSRITARLCDLYHCIPFSTEPGAVDDMHISWGLDMASAECLSVEGSRQLASFLAWYDFCDQVLAEAHPAVGQALAKEIKEIFFCEVFTDDVLTQPLAVTILAKLFKVVASPLLNKAINEWFVGEHVEKEPVNSTKPAILQSLLSNWTSQRSDLVLETLRFFEVVLDKGNVHVLNSLLFVYLNDGSFVDKTSTDSLDVIETDEASSRINKLVNSFVNLVPLGLRNTESGGYEQYLSESQRQYSAVLASLKKQGVDPYAVPSVPISHETENGRRRDLFYEGPFLRTLFNALANIPYQPYEINLELTGIVSKVCLRPEYYLSLFLVESCVINVVPEANTLHSVLHRIAALLASAVMILPDYENCLKATRLKLISDQAIQLPIEEDKWSMTFENIVVIEELCKELAAIAYI